jgi:hypothetical protein
MPNLFELGSFTSHSGLQLDWKINCDALTDDDWECLAYIAVKELQGYHLGVFGMVEGVPTGGLKFAQALQKYITPDSDILLIADDVSTTCTSMQNHRNGREAIGVVVFMRNAFTVLMSEDLEWIIPIFRI